MFPSSALQVIEQTSSRVVIWDPPSYARAAFVVIAALGAPLFLLLLAKPVSKARIKAALLGLLFALPFLLTGIFLLTSDMRIVMSRDSRKMMVEHRRFGFRSRNEIPLNDIAYAKVETADQQARALVVILRSGQVISLTQQTDQEGHYAAAMAINNFLGIHNPPQ
jgi:hypothetical protein